MAYFDRNELNEAPFDGEFYETTVDTTKPLDEQTVTEVTKLQVKCDIVKASHTRVNGFMKAAYSIFVPFDRETETIIVNRGDMFRAWVYGVLIKGQVEGVFPSQLGGYECYVQADEIDNQTEGGD